MPGARSQDPQRPILHHWRFTLAISIHHIKKYQQSLILLSINSLSDLNYPPLQRMYVHVLCVSTMRWHVQVLSKIMAGLMMADRLNRKRIDGGIRLVWFVLYELMRDEDVEIGMTTTNSYCLAMQYDKTLRGYAVNISKRTYILLQTNAQLIMGCRSCADSCSMPNCCPFLGASIVFLVFDLCVDFCRFMSTMLLLLPGWLRCLHKRFVKKHWCGA